MEVIIILCAIAIPASIIGLRALDHEDDPNSIFYRRHRGQRNWLGVLGAGLLLVCVFLPAAVLRYAGGIIYAAPTLFDFLTHERYGWGILYLILMAVIGVLYATAHNTSAFLLSLAFVLYSNWDGFFDPSLWGRIFEVADIGIYLFLLGQLLILFSLFFGGVNAKIEAAFRRR